jgi:hypothetical protein
MEKMTSKFKVLVVCLLFGIVTDVVQAQDFKFTVGPRMDERPAGHRMFFNTALQKGYRVITYKDFAIAPVDGYLDLPGTAIPVKSEVFGGTKNAALQGFHTINKKNYLIYSTLDKERKALTVYTQELSPEMVLLGSPIRMAEFSNINTFTTLNYEPDDIFIVKSKSQQQIVLVKQVESHLQVKAFNPDKGELWSKVFELDPDFEVKLNAMEIAENGNVYVSGAYFKREKLKSPFLLAYSPTSKVHKLHTIQSDEKAHDMGYIVKLLGDDMPVVGGLYSNKLNDGGYRIYKVNPGSLALETFMSQPFSKAYKSVVYNTGVVPVGFSVCDMVQLTNGNIVLTIESGYTHSMKYVSSSYSSSTYVASIDKGGVEKWNTTIQKKQGQPMGGNLLGHLLFYRGNKVYLLYNDNLDNFDLAPTDKQKESLLKNKTYVATAEIDETGKTRKLYLCSTNKKQVSSFSVNNVRPIENNLFHFLVEIEDSFQFATLRANE